MGQKVHPTGYRLGYIKDWESTWYADGKDYAEQLCADISARTLIKKKLANAAISKIKIERPKGSVRITLHTARPGVVIGKKGDDIERLRAEVSKLLGLPVNINIEEIRKPELDARLVAESIAQSLENRIMFRRAMKRAESSAIRLGAKGIRINVAGRLNGAEIARTEWYREGQVPLHTLRADIDYSSAQAHTSYGILGIKVWIYKGEIYNADKQKSMLKQEPKARKRK